MDAITEKQYVECVPSLNFQQCLDENVSSVIRTPPGHFEINPITLNSNQRLVISKHTVLKLADTAQMPLKGGFVMGLIGREEAKLENVLIVLNGVIDGNKYVHPYEKSGNECLNINYSKYVFIWGSGSVRNCSGDGIDIDDSQEVLLFGITAKYNSGSGIHIGSGRPIKFSKGVVAIGVRSIENGFKNERFGMDASWPNYNAATYILSKSQGNYQNYDLVGPGSIALLNQSLDGYLPDRINGVHTHKAQLRNSIFQRWAYYEILINRDIDRLKGYPWPDAHQKLPYLREWQ